MLKKLLKKWKGKIYQTNNKRVKERYEFFRKNSHIFKGLNVFEIGCNAGLFTIEVMKHADTYLGIEKEKKYYDQAVVTKEYLGDNATFLNISFSDFLKRYEGRNFYDAIVLSRVLYYFSDDELQIIKEKILPKCKAALIVCGKKPKKHKSNSYDMWKMKNVVEFLGGFKCEISHDSEKAFFMIKATR